MDTVVYEWRRGDGTPYYIGIGKPERPYRGRRRCGPPPPKERIVILHEGLSWEKACEIERELIALHGRKDLGTGVLRNMTDGGEGTRGLVVSGETRAKMSGENNPMYGKTGENSPKYGKTLSEETRAKMSEAKSGENNPMYGRMGENNPNHGKKRTEETRAKISEAKSGENHHFYGITRENNPMYGKKLSEETKAKISEANSGKNHPCYTPRNWYHPVHGEVLQKSVSELVKMFPEQNLKAGSLSLVANGKQSHHKGWISVESSSEDQSPGALPVSPTLCQQPHCAV